MAADLPPALKPISQYLVIGKQFAKRDPVITYYAFMYSVQEGIKLASSDPAAKSYVFGLMDQLDAMKKGVMKDSPQAAEALASDLVAQAHVEEVGLKLFANADAQDRNSNFSKSTVKSFLTASHLFTILKQFGELSEDVEGKMKYAKWKAVEITKCQKNGITPTPGPPEGMGEEDVGATGLGPPPTTFPPSQPGDASTSYFPQPPTSYGMDKPVPKPRHNVRPDQPEPGMWGGDMGSMPPQNPPGYGFRDPEPAEQGGGASGGGGAVGGGMAVGVGPEATAKAQKLCKFASSALDYEDVAGAVDFLQQALKILTTRN